MLLTGTPLQNNMTELWALLEFLMPDIFARFRKKNPVRVNNAGMIDADDVDSLISLAT